MSLDEAKEAFDRLRADTESVFDKIETEQDTRFQIIDRMLTAVLGWDRLEILNEPRSDSGYLDYLISSRGQPLLVVEAKRASRILLDTHSPRMAAYKVGGAALRSASDGLDQAKRYCTDKAVLFSALTSGVEWIGFWALRTDSRPPSEGKAVAFPSLAAIEENFAAFHDLFSRTGVESRLYQTIIHGHEGLHVQHAERLEAIRPEDSVHLLRKPELSADISQVFRRFFSTIAGDDPEMLVECFVESKESREADASLTKIAQNLINRIDVVDPGRAEGLEREIRSAIDTRRGEFVLVIGNKGAGKSTFIDRFFRIVLDRALRARCTLIRIDLADSPGDVETVASWLTTRLKEGAEQSLFRGASPTYEALQGLFMGEYDRWRYGERKYLYERDKTAFKEQFGDWIANIVRDEPYEYTIRLLQSAVLGQGRMPCLIFDNTDHFPQPFQEAVFQFAQGIHRSVFSFVICPITDHTVWRLSKAGPFQSYDTRAFYLPVPSTKEVLSKRVSFLKEKIGAEKRADSGRYFLDRGIRLTVSNLEAFATTVEAVFVEEEYIGRVVGWLSNHDVRRSLRVAERIITSPILKTDTLFKAYVIGKAARPGRREIEKALFVGDYDAFKQNQSEFVLNLFEVQPDAMTSPLLRVSLLRLLMDRHFDPSSPW